VIDDALEYARFGWPVFPLRPRGKTPLTPKGYKDATDDTAQVLGWWSRHPNANIGIPTGLAFDVLDIDGDEGLNEASRLFGGDDIELPCGPAVLTSTGGLHLYFRPTGVGNRARFRPGLDWRGAGGYVVGPPSIGANGERYRWWPLVDCVDSPLEPAPGWLVDLLKRELRTPSAPPPPNPGGRVSEYAFTALEDESRAVVAAPVGERNDRLNRAAFALGRLVAEGMLDRTIVERVLMAAATEAGLSATEAVRTIRSGLDARGVR
jgi:hypothetical protein